MKTRINKIVIDWDEMFNHSSSVRDYTCDFAEGTLSGKMWVHFLWGNESQLAAKRMIRTFGVASVRKRARRWVKRVCYCR